MRICVLGNSHVASIKKAWDMMSQDYPDYEFMFFASRGIGLSKLKAEDGKLLPGDDSLRANLAFTSGSNGEIDPSDFDVFLVYGANCRPYFKTETFYSQTVLQASVEDYTQNSLAINLIKLLRQVTEKKIFLGHNPLQGAPLSDKKSQSRENYFRCCDFINQNF